MRKRDGEKGVRVVREFDSLQEFLSETPSKVNYNNPTSTEMRGDAPDHHEITWRNGSYGTTISNASQFKAFLNEGWSKGVRKMEQTLSQIPALPTVKSIRRTPIYAEMGDAVELQRLWQGRPDFWNDMSRTNVEGQGAKFVRVWVSVNMNAGRKGDAFFWRGAAACVLAQRLEEAGYAVEVIGFEQCHGLFTDKHSIAPDRIFIIPLKRFDEHLDVARLACMTAHPASLRVAVFNANEAIEFPVSEGHGMPEEYKPCLLSEEGDITVNGIWGKEEAQAFLTKTLAKFTPQD